MSGKCTPYVVALFLAAATAGRADNLDIVTAARQQVGVTLAYDGGYQSLRYPGGDVPLERGVCTDVIVRALRTARALDLQKVMHEDIVAHRDAYPHQRRWGTSHPDRNIDHRRVPNQMAWFGRQGWSRAIGTAPTDYLPGDIVAWNLGRGILHIGVISDRKAVTGAPLVIHNIGAGAREEDMLFRFKIIGHYRPGAPSTVRYPLGMLFHVAILPATASNRVDWRKRNADLQEKSDILHTDLIRQRNPGIPKDGVLIYLEAMRTAMRNGLRETPEALSRRNCELMPGRLTGDTYDPARAQPEAYQLINDFPIH